MFERSSEGRPLTRTRCFGVTVLEERVELEELAEDSFAKGSVEDELALDVEGRRLLTTVSHPRPSVAVEVEGSPVVVMSIRERMGLDVVGGGGGGCPMADEKVKVDDVGVGGQAVACAYDSEGVVKAVEVVRVAAVVVVAVVIVVPLRSIILSSCNNCARGNMTPRTINQSLGL